VSQQLEVGRQVFESPRQVDSGWHLFQEGFKENTNTMKTLLAVGVLAVSSLSILSAKTYDLTITGPTKAGSVQLKAGQYRLKVDGANATFTDVSTSKSFTTPVKVETTDKKFDDTKVQSTKDGDAERIEEIDLGGSKTKLGF
jgi:hypothetical protein